MEASGEVVESGDGWLMKLIGLIGAFWLGLPDRSKERIVDSITNGFEATFRHFFRKATAPGAPAAEGAAK